MKKVVTIVEKNGVEHTVSMTAEQADYYLRLAQMRASSPDDVMREFSNLVIKKGQQDARRSKAQ